MTAMPGSTGDGISFVGARHPLADTLADALPAPRRVEVPDVPTRTGWQWEWADALDAWRDALAPQLQGSRSIVVCTWPPAAPSRLVDLSPDAWVAAAEWPFALWFSALSVAATTVADGGAVVAVVERPVALDAPGYAASMSIGEGVLALVRSLASAEGARGVRVNAVTTEVATAPPVLLGAAPTLPAFPGRPGHEVAGAVRLLLSPDACGITGTAVRADCGRSWS
jgi:NAD(P)-dependent dehydrogenase (short-subunit alcohol dehydrogenase family)